MPAENLWDGHWMKKRVRRHGSQPRHGTGPRLFASQLLRMKLVRSGLAVPGFASTETGPPADGQLIVQFHLKLQ
jgi:hypothetical protein